jgi:hypothetical protein
MSRPETLVAQGAMLPRSGRDLISRAIKSDVGLKTDPAARHEYEARAAASKSQ